MRMFFPVINGKSGEHSQTFVKEPPNDWKGDVVDDTFIQIIFLNFSLLLVKY